MARLPFTFAQKHQVALDGDRLLYGPDASEFGLREARRQLGGAANLVKLSQEKFETTVSSLYELSLIHI